MLWAKKVERDERTCLKEVERERKIMIHKNAKDITNHEKDTERLNTRLSAMESNFDEERSKYHKNINRSLHLVNILVIFGSLLVKVGLHC